MALPQDGRAQGVARNDIEQIGAKPSTMLACRLLPGPAMNAVTPLPMPLSGSRVNLRSSSGRGWNGFGVALPQGGWAQGAARKDSEQIG